MVAPDQRTHGSSQKYEICFSFSKNCSVHVTKQASEEKENS